MVQYRNGPSVQEGPFSYLIEGLLLEIKCIYPLLCTDDILFVSYCLPFLGRGVSVCQGVDGDL